jgi:hypothetical protein
MPTTFPDGNDVRANPIRRLLLVSGFAIAILSLAINVLVMVAWGRSPFSYGLRVFYAYPFLLCEAAPVLLLIGMVGLQQRKRWARGVLFSYVGVWLVGRVLLCIFNCLMVQNSVGSGRVQRTVSQRIAINAGQFQPLIYDAAYPLILIVLLRLPEVKEMFSNPARGFSPLLPSDEPVPAEPLSAEVPTTGGSL